MFPGTDKYSLGYKIMPSREYTDLEETKPSYMVGGTENKHTVTILENCRNY